MTDCAPYAAMKRVVLAAKQGNEEAQAEAFRLRRMSIAADQRAAATRAEWEHQFKHYEVVKHDHPIGCKCHKR